jgi:5-methyltetrahydrofolate--homocysteine methyltransferase
MLFEMDIHGIMPGNLTQETVLDLRELKDKVGDRICIFDNINPNGSLLIGKPEEVAAETLAHLEKARGMSGYIFSTSGTTSPFIPRENSAGVVALSALLTTTMPAMETTVAAIKEAGLAAMTIIGGAPVTEAFADQVGSDGYSDDAPGAVELVRKLMAA